ncbi:urea ABC transporter permease subunit UrtC [Nitrospinaceae bacterium]|nr:urea ABC transporter permease subunit UrtC [Nitrospinaceae bacterium]
MIKQIAALHSFRGWLLSFGLLFAAIILLPVLNIFVPEESFFHIPDYMFPLLGKYLCYAMVALAVDLIWGYTGILSLGHGVFFSMGGYAMGMYLMRSIGKEGVYKSDLPDFMVFLDWKELPWYWYGFDYFSFALLIIFLLPGLFAFVFGYFAFRSRIKGVYFAIITQAMTYALMLLFFRNNTGFGGNNGLTDFKRILGYSLQEPSTKMGLFMITALVLFLSYVISRYIVKSKLGRILTAIRDVESRVMFSGYNTLHYKLFIWTISAFLCGIAGALYVPQVGIINPSEMQPTNSIEMAIWVAVGGRGTLVGALFGAGLVNVAKSWFTVAAPDYWLYFLGVLFIVVTLFFPKGFLGFFKSFSIINKVKEPANE